MGVKLPDELSGKEYEEAVSAYIKALGYFTEKRIILDHNGRELFELDIVASPANESFTRRVLIDAKSGKKTGFADIFKIFGWRTFLNIPCGCIVRKSGPSENDSFALANYYDELKMSWEVFNLESDNIEMDMSETLPQVYTSLDDEMIIHHFIVGWWFNIAERIAFSEYQTFIKTCEDKVLVQKLRSYEKACMLSFFEKNPLKRVVELYDAFKSNPLISNQCMEYLENVKGKSRREIQDKIFNTHEYLWLQYVALLEHRARYLIIKSAVEIHLTADDSTSWDSLSREHYLNLTPNNFQFAFRKIGEYKYKELIPNFYQIFIESFGGYYIEGKKEDLELLSKLTNLPFSELNNAFEMINDFFPTRNGWYQASKDVIRLKFLPTFIRGVGSFMRHKLLCNEYSELSSQMGWLLADYHNQLIKILEKDKKLHNN